MSHLATLRADLVALIESEVRTALRATHRRAPALLTIEEVSEASRAPVGSVRDWIADGRLRASRPGKRVLVRRVDLAAFLGVEESDLEIAAVAGVKP